MSIINYRGDMMLSKLLLVFILFFALTIFLIIISIIKIYQSVREEKEEALIREKEFVDSIKKAKWI